MRCYGITPPHHDGKTLYFQRKKDAIRYYRGCDPWGLSGIVIFGKLVSYASHVTTRDDIPSRNIIKANQYY